MSLKPIVHFHSAITSAGSLNLVAELAEDMLVLGAYDQSGFVHLEEYNWFSKPDWSSSVTKFTELISLPEYKALPVKLILRNRLFTLIPSTFSLDSLRKDFFHLVVPDCDKQTILKTTILEGQNATLVYALPKELYSLLNTQQNRLEVQHDAEAKLQRTKSEVKDKDRVFVQVHGGYFSLAVFSKTSLCLLNTYPFSTEKDFIFMVLSALQQVNVNTDPELRLSGKIVAGSKLHDQLKTYFSNIAFDSFDVKGFPDHVSPSHYPQIVHVSGLCG